MLILVDVPTGKINCQDIFDKVLKLAPDHIQAKQHSKGTHTGRGTSWAGAYTTYEVYDERRPDWPTQDAEEWGRRAELEILAHLRQTKVR